MTFFLLQFIVLLNNELINEFVLVYFTDNVNYYRRDGRRPSS